MPLYQPQSNVTAGGITVDGQGFMTIPGDADAAPFKIEREILVGGPPHRYRVVILDTLAQPQVIYSADK